MHCCSVVIEHCNTWQKQPLLHWAALREEVVSPGQHGDMCSQILWLQDFYYGFDPVAGSSIITFFIIRSCLRSVFGSKAFDWWVYLHKRYYVGTVIFPLHGVHFSGWWDVVLGSVLMCVLSLCSGSGNMAQKDPTKFYIILVRINPIIAKVSLPWWVNLLVKIQWLAHKRKWCLQELWEN